MDMPSIMILAIGTGVVMIAAALLWLVSGQAVRLASTSQELLDLFEEGVPRQSKASAPAMFRPSTPSAFRGTGRSQRQRVTLQASRPGPMQQARYRWAQA